jgi:hypothetical protein
MRASSHSVDDLVVLPDDTEVLEASERGQLGELVSRVLAALIGQPLADLGHAADLIWIGFGRIVSAPTTRDRNRTIAVHRLHIQCACRLDGPSGVVVGSEDLLDSSSGAGAQERETTLFRLRADAFLKEHSDAPIVCEGVKTADSSGGFSLRLSDGHALTVFPATSRIQEHWRYFLAGEPSRHFVVLPKG